MTAEAYGNASAVLSWRRVLLELFFHISAGEGEKVKFFCAGMDEAKGFVPCTQQAVFFNDANGHQMTALFSGLGEGVEQKLFSHSPMPERWGDTEIVQLAFAIFFQKQGIETDNIFSLAKNVHGSVFEVLEG